jgi:hypothetical protein
MVDEILYQYQDEMLRQTTQKHFRYLYDDIDWRARMIGIIGPRGVVNQPCCFSISSIFRTRAMRSM